MKHSENHGNHAHWVCVFMQGCVQKQNVAFGVKRKSLK